MQIKCEYCGSMIDDSLTACPNCGAASSGMGRAARKIPKTIDELKAFCADRKLNLERMHFHIGEDYRGPKAFGIYKDSDGNFVVYKNKTDGSRAVRYRGTDEAYAVNEIYQKLKAEVLEVRERKAAMKSAPSTRSGGRPSKKKNKPGSSKTIAIIIAIFIGICILSALFDDDSSSRADTGYYDYGGSTYYHDHSGWYMYNDDEWLSVDADDYLEENYSDYYDDSYSGEEFETRYYDYEDNWEDDWDDDDWDWSWDDDDDWSWDDDDDWDDDWDWDDSSDWDDDW